MACSPEVAWYFGQIATCFYLFLVKLTFWPWRW
jgi:hypothetical protein